MCILVYPVYLLDVIDYSLNVSKSDKLLPDNPHIYLVICTYKF